MNKIGKILKQERLKNNLTLRALSNISNISISTLSKMENDNIRNVSSVFLFKICYTKIKIKGRYIWKKYY